MFWVYLLVFAAAAIVLFYLGWSGADDENGAVKMLSIFLTLVAIDPWSVAGSMLLRYMGLPLLQTLFLSVGSGFTIAAVIHFNDLFGAK